MRACVASVCGPVSLVSQSRRCRWADARRNTFCSARVKRRGSGARAQRRETPRAGGAERGCARDNAISAPLVCPRSSSSSTETPPPPSWEPFSRRVDPPRCSLKKLSGSCRASAAPAGRVSLFQVRTFVLDEKVSEELRGAQTPQLEKRRRGLSSSVRLCVQMNLSDRRRRLTMRSSSPAEPRSSR